MHNSRAAVARSWVGNLGVALCSTVLTLALIEGAFRLTAYYDERRTLHAFQHLGQSDHTIAPETLRSVRQIIRLSANPRIIYELIPNLSFVFRNKQYTMNAHGFRGPEYSTVKEKRVLRVVGIGDSVMWGWGVSDNEYYLALLSQALNQSSPAGDRWEIINTAVPGYNTAMEVETFKDKGLLYAPDLVIIDFVGNDLSLPNFIRKKENGSSPLNRGEVQLEWTWGPDRLLLGMLPSNARGGDTPWTPRPYSAPIRTVLPEAKQVGAILVSIRRRTTGASATYVTNRSAPPKALSWIGCALRPRQG